MIHFNFRKDRPRQLISALFKPDFEHFDRRGLHGVKVTCMMEYDQWYGLPIAFDHDMPKITLGQILSQAGLPQFHCAETEKYAHVTFFLMADVMSHSPAKSAYSFLHRRLRPMISSRK